MDAAVRKNLKHAVGFAEAIGRSLWTLETFVVAKRMRRKLLSEDGDKPQPLSSQ